MTKEEEVKRK